MPSETEQPEAFDLYGVEPDELLKLVKKAGGQRAFARKHNLKRTTLQARLYKLREDPFKHRPAPEAREVAKTGTGRRRFILSSAQDGTRVHEPFLENLEAYRDYLAADAPCEILIAGFTYNKSLFEDHSKKHKPIFYPRIIPYLANERIRIADQIDFCGEMNTLPTAVTPLSGFHTYTRERWGIFPHAKVQLVSVPTMKNAPPKQIMTTGAVTKPNYVMKKAGIKASFHHIYGAVLVEVDDDGTFFCRHLIGDEDGSFYDLDRFVHGGVVKVGFRVKVLTPGDIHVFQIDPTVARATFGFGPNKERNAQGLRTWSDVETPSMIDVLQPENVIVHDVADFRVRNHHNIGDPHDRFRLHINGTDKVEDELREVAMFLTMIDRRYPSTQVTVAESNHDQALLKWLKTGDYRFDPANATFFLKCQLAAYEAIEHNRKGFSIFEHVMNSAFDPWACERVRFLREDESFMIGGVEHSNHGHRGPNGSRGSVQGLSRIGPRVTMGHVHSPQILDGAYAAGTSSLLDMGYNSGPSSWAHSHVVQYANGKRALITFQGGRWRL